MTRKFDYASQRKFADDFMSGISGVRKNSSSSEDGAVDRYGVSLLTRRNEDRDGTTHKMNKAEYKEIKKEAKIELKSNKSNATRVYEQTLDEAKSRYLKNAERFRLEYHAARKEARRDYKKSLEFAQHDYDFTIDIAKDQYKNEKGELPNPWSSDPTPGRLQERSEFGDDPKVIPEESVSEWDPEFNQIYNSEEIW